MNKIDYCFCTIAYHKRYRDMAKHLARDLDKYANGIPFVVMTDKPKEFKNIKNVLVYKYNKKSIMRCANDRRFLLEKALTIFNTAIHIDSDSRLTGEVPRLNFSPGLTNTGEDLIKHVSKNRPDKVSLIKRLASKLNISLDGANWIGESLYIITKDDGKEKEFLKAWDIIAKYMELHGFHGGDGNAMGLAAAKVNLNINLNQEPYISLRKITKHQDASYIKKSFLEKWNLRINYHYRLNKARLLALKDYNFYYR